MRTSEIYRGIKRPFMAESVGLNVDNSNKYLTEKGDRDEISTEYLLLTKYDTGRYLELTSSRVYSDKELEIENLVPFTRMFDCKNNISMFKAIKMYNQKMLEKLPVKNLCLGNIGFVAKAIREDSNDEVKLTLKCSPIKSRALLLKDNDTYTDLETHIKYSRAAFQLGNIIVVSEEPIYDYLASEDTTEDSIEYYKILSKYRKRIK